MELKKQNILFFLRAPQHGGTENVVMQLCRILKPMVNKIVVCSADGFKTELLDVLGIQHYEIPDIENRSPTTVLSILCDVRRIIQKEQITVVHTHHRMAAFYTRLLSKLYKFVFLNTCHNTFKNKRVLTRLAYKNVHIITCGEMVRRNLTEYFGLPDDQITVIHNAVEPFDEKISTVYELMKWKKIGYSLVGNIGRLSEQKGMKYFIEALPLVKKSCPMVKFIIIGDGEDRKKLEDQANALNVSDSVIFLGYRNDIRNVMSQLDFIVLSSLWEGLPLTPIEAFSVGKTVVATAVDGTVEIVNDGKNGFLVEAKNVKQLADRIVVLIKQLELRHVFEEKGKEKYLQEFSFEIYKKRILDYYSSI